MSGNSCDSALQTAPIVSDLRGASPSTGAGGSGVSVSGSSDTAIRYRAR